MFDITGFNGDHLEAMVRAIRAFISGQTYVKNPEGANLAKFEAWAKRLENEQVSAGDVVAMRHIRFLPYTFPYPETHPTALGTFLAALYLIGNCRIDTVEHSPLKLTIDTIEDLLD